MFKLNYGEYVFQQLVTTEFVQQKLSFILISLVVNIINLHLVSILCILLSLNVYVDFFLQIAVSVFMALNIDSIYNFVERYEKEFYRLTQYLIKNYSIENYRYWKRITVIGGCSYLSIILLFVEVTNRLLYIYILQYAICFFIIESLERKRIQRFIQDYKDRPKAVIHTDDPATDFLVKSYLSPESNVLKANPTPKNAPIVRKHDSFYLIDKQSHNVIADINYNDYHHGIVGPVRRRRKKRN